MMKLRTKLHKELANYNRLNKKVILNDAKAKKIISFDIFDTLLKRSVKDPTDVFRLIEINENIPNFSQRRIHAEKLARQKVDFNEVTLNQIYDYFEGIEDKEQLKKIEIDYEEKLSSCNYEIRDLYIECLKFTKVILISDMYLPREVIENLLSENKINNYYKLFISNEIGETKLNGKLYDYVLNDLNISPNQILHIGNSFRADYLVPKKLNIKSMKVATYKNNMQREYKNVLNADKFKLDTLNSFINTHERDKNDYFNFGYEVFGPLLFGFTNWLLNRMKKENIKQVYFLSRDGYIMKKLYDQLGFDKIIPSTYFEVSRRSLRVPNYTSSQSYADIIDTLTVPNMTNLIQIFDTLGLDINQYKQKINDHGMNVEEPLKRDKLIDNKKFHSLFEDIKNDVFDNAKKEKKLLLKYLDQCNFNVKTAIVDIGWAGSMEKYLAQSLKDMGVNADIIGFYVGLTLKSRENLGKNNLRGYGYVFDCLNNINDRELESSFIGLIETLFLEQHGSVKKYKEIENGKIIAERYPYEYIDSKGNVMPEAKDVFQLQQGALQFAQDFSNAAEITKLILSNNDNKIMFNNLYAVGTDPKKNNIKQFGWFTFFNDGSKVHLAQPLKIYQYLSKPSRLKKDIYDSQWKIGFLKSLLKIDLPYLSIFKYLRKKANK